jgi:ATP-dependent Lon protease
MLKNSHLFESIPTAFVKGAFLDRIHLYNPGWEIKMLKKDSFSKGYGLITDYIAAVLHAMRNTDLTGLLKDYAKFDGSLSERDHLAIRKTFSGMVKLLYPDQNYTDEEAYELIEFAAECRKRVKDQLYVVDETFTAEPAKFEYTNLKTGEKHQVKTLEQIENDFVPAHEQTLPDDETAELPDSTAGNGSSESERAASESGTDIPSTQPKRKQLASKFIEVRANQSNVSYKRLFGDYLETASHIIITDPYIRAPFQIDNLVEFIQTARECCTNNEELNIEVHTLNDEEKIPEMIDTFDELKDELAAVGIEFSYFFDADHDRNIVLDNGWKITLSRGLDIFEKFGRFSLGSVRQTNRRCRAFSVTYVQE